MTKVPSPPVLCDADLPQAELPRELSLSLESRRLTERYIREVVLNFGLCPWAKSALEDGRVAIKPILGEFLGRTAARAAARSLMNELEATPLEIELVLAPFPELDMTRPEFDEVARELRELDREKNFALAAFHPAPVEAPSDPARAAMFLRRSPDPMIQVVRSSVLERIAPGEGEGTTFVDLGALLHSLVRPVTRSTRERIVEHNFSTLKRERPETFEAIFELILADRGQSYAKFLGAKSEKGGP